MLAEPNFGCGRCLNLLNNPVTLPCDHVYCMPCLQSIHPSKCPFDEKMYVTKDLSVNPTLKDLIADFKSADLLGNHGDLNSMCQFCKSDPKQPTKFCVKCEGYFCDECCASQHAPAPMKRHQIINASDAIVYPACEYHPVENIRFYIS